MLLLHIVIYMINNNNIQNKQKQQGVIYSYIIYITP